MTFLLGGSRVLDHTWMEKEYRLCRALLWDHSAVDMGWARRELQISRMQSSDPRTREVAFTGGPGDLPEQRWAQAAL